MDGMIVVRLIAVVFLVVAIAAAVVEIARDRGGPTSSEAPVAAPSPDPLREAQRRCQQLGQAAALNKECLRVWAETRDRFLGRTTGPSGPETSGRP